MLTEQQIAQTNSARKAMNRVKGRFYMYSPDNIVSITKKYKHNRPDVQLYRFVNDNYGSILDSYILYAISCMGWADVQSIAEFLLLIKQQNDSLGLPTFKEDSSSLKMHDVVRAGVSRVENAGFITGIVMEYKTQDEMMKVKTVSRRMNTLTKDGYYFLNQSLGTKVFFEEWSVAKPFSEILGNAATSFIAVNVAKARKNRGDIQFISTHFMTKKQGLMHVSINLKMEIKKDYTSYVGFLPVYLYYDKMRQTLDVYREMVIRKQNEVRNYIGVHEAKHSGCKVRFVLVCDDNLDLLRIGKYIYEAGVLNNYLDRIYFTSEALYLDRKEFLQMYLSESETNGFNFFVSVPDF